MLGDLATARSKLTMLARRPLEAAEFSLEVRGALRHGVPFDGLEISLLTVNGHLGSLYRKCGVSGREELFGRLG